MDWVLICKWQEDWKTSLHLCSKIGFQSSALYYWLVFPFWTHGMIELNFFKKWIRMIAIYFVFFRRVMSYTGTVTGGFYMAILLEGLIFVYFLFLLFIIFNSFLFVFPFISFVFRQTSFLHGFMAINFDHSWFSNLCCSSSISCWLFELEMERYHLFKTSSKNRKKERNKSRINSKR